MKFFQRAQDEALTADQRAAAEKAEAKTAPSNSSAQDANSATSGQSANSVQDRARLPSVFQNFVAAKREVFFTSATPSLTIDAACPVGIVTGNANEIIVEIDADVKDLPKFTSRQTGQEISVTQTGSSTGGGISIGGNVVFSSGGGISICGSGHDVSVINGHVFIDGQLVTPGQQQANNSTKEPRIIITAPNGSDLYADMKSGPLVSFVALNEAAIDISGSCNAEVIARELSGELSSRGLLVGDVRGGDAAVTVSGSGDIRLKGEYNDLKVRVSGSGDIKTTGTVNGHFDARVSGSGDIVHTGPVRGRVKKHVSGSGDILIK
jgi:hypothetical protein